MKYETAIVLGAGAFGTSIASVLTHRFKKVILLVRSKDIYQDLLQRENKVYLPGVKLPIGIFPAQSWHEVDQLCGNNKKFELVISGLPTKSLNEYFHENKTQISKILSEGSIFISLSKGIDDQFKLPDEILENIFPDFHDAFCYLSGPSFAKEIVEKQITLVSLAGKSRINIMKASEMLQTSFFRVQPTYDIKGLLLGGALKNILAIAGGILEGLGYNHNTRAAMITRGIEEMLRFGVVFNARPETFYGLSGMGDLILTTTGDLSRNKQFGLEIAKGRKPEEIINSQRSVVEGYKTTKAAYELAQKFEIRARLFQGMYGILYQNVDPKLIIEKLMELPVKFSHE